MDGFTGFTTATTEALPDAVAVMDPFHVVALAGAPGPEVTSSSRRESMAVIPVTNVGVPVGVGLEEGCLIHPGRGG